MMVCWLCVPVSSLVCVVAVLWFVFPMPGLWACVISGRYAFLPYVWGLVVVWVAGSVSG